jgi:hypothetical protein
MAEIANHEVISAKETVEQLISQSTVAPVKLVYAAKKTHDELKEESDDLEDFRIELLQQYAETGEEGQILRKTDEDGEELSEAKFPDDEALQQFQQNLTKIYSDTVEIDAHTVDINEVGDFEAPAEWGKNLRFMFDGIENRTEVLRGGQVQASTDSVESILHIGRDSEAPPMPLKFSAALYETYDSLLENQREIEKRRFELLQEYAKTGDEGGIVTEEESNDAEFPDEEAEEEFHEELNELYNESFDIDAHLVELDYTDGVEIHPRHTIILDWMFTD